MSLQKILSPNLKSIITLSLATVVLGGCLKTRAELEAEQSGQQQESQTQAQQREHARETPPIKEKAPPTAYRFEEYDEQMRTLSGRMEAVEAQNQQLYTLMKAERDGGGKDKQQLDQKFATFEEALKKLELEVQQLNEEVTKLKTAPPPPPVTSSATSGSAAAKSKSSFEEGEELFTAKKWKEAIVSFQKYRDGNPKGKSYADATYKIGICFQELGMKEEAKAFYDEVTAKFPKSKEAKKASLRLKTLK